MAKKLVFSFLKGILAGLAIGVGGFLYVIMCYAVPGEFGKILGSLLFAVGLFTVCTFQLSLYTGKIGVVFEGRQTKDFYWSLPIMLIGNAIGAVGLGYVCFAIFRNTSVMDTVAAINASRLALATFENYFVIALKAFLCGFCVYMAVKLFSLNRLKPVGILSLVAFVFIFVYCGFQHCIANMFYFGFGNSFPAEAFINLALCIVFNSFGPIIGVLIFKMIDKAKAK